MTSSRKSRSPSRAQCEKNSIVRRLQDALARKLTAALGRYHKPLPPGPDDPVAYFNRGNALAQRGDHEGAVASLREAIRCKPDFAAAYCNLGLSLKELGAGGEAREMLEKAVRLDPDNPAFAANLRIVSAQLVPLWHFSMMNDAARNDAYEGGIRAAVSPGDRVLEIGTGSGLLAMMAARAGAGHVYTCEVVDALASKAREIMEANGQGATVSVIAKHSTAVAIPQDLPDRGRILVAEIISSDLIGEGLLPAYEDAKARLLIPDARVIPREAWVRGQLVSVTGLEPFTRVDSVSGFDLSGFNDFRPLKVHPGEVEMEVTALSAPFDIFHFDLQAATTFPSERRSLRVQASQRGVCAGLLQWIRLDLGGGFVYENGPAPLRRAGHWQQGLYLMQEPFAVESHETLVVTAKHNRGNLLLHVGRGPHAAQHMP